MENIIAGMLLPSGTGVEPQPVFVTGLDSLQQMVGGAIDAMTTTLDAEDCVIVGYINDEGAILGLEFNYIASALFGRHVFGECVIVWGLDEDGVYDGESYDLPSEVVAFINESLMPTVAKGYGTATLMHLFCEIAIDLGLANVQEVSDHAEQLMLSAQMGREVSSDKEHIDYFINIIKVVLACSEAELDETLLKWAEILLEDLVARRER